MKAKQLTTILFAATMLLFSSCSKDSTPADLTPDEAKTELKGVTTNYQTELNSLSNCKSIEALITFSQLGGSKMLPSSMVQTLSPEAIKKTIKGSLKSTQLGLITKSNSSFDFNALKGEYKYVQGEFVKTSTKVDAIVFIYPYNAKSGVNNCTFTINTLKMQELNTEPSYVPVEISASLKIDNIQEFTLDYKATLTNIKIDGIASSGVASYELKMFMNPFTLEMGQKLNAAPNTYSYSDNMTLKRGSNQIASTSKEVNLRSKNIESGDFTVTATFMLQVLNIKAEGKVNASSSDVANDIMPDLNKLASFNLYKFPEGNKIGSIIAASAPADGNPIPTFVFADGTNVPLQQLIAELLGIVEQ